MAVEANGKLLRDSNRSISLNTHSRMTASPTRVFHYADLDILAHCPLLFEFSRGLTSIAGIPS